LALFQAELSAALSVPVIASSLAQVNLVKAMLPPGKIPGILTVSAKALTPDHLKGAGVSLDTPIQGTENGREFTRALLDNELELDVELARQDNVEAAQELVRRHSEIGAIVLECTNMIPYAADIRRATGLPVYSIYDLVTWFHAGLSPRRFAAG
jgi:Asp/Glu/hydantoin racemase